MIKLIFMHPGAKTLDENGRPDFPDGGKLLGVHVVGEIASELVHTGMACLHFGGGIDYFIESVFNYPTLSDVYKYAAFDALGKLNQLRGSVPAAGAALIPRGRIKLVTKLERSTIVRRTLADAAPLSGERGEPLAGEEIVRYELFSMVSKNLLDKNPGSVWLRAYEPGETICRQGEYGSTAFYIHSGKVRVLDRRRPAT